MIWVLIGVLVAQALGYFAFAVLEPPAMLHGWFRVPAIFVFLPDRFVLPVGRAFAGLCCLGFAAFLVVYTLGHRPATYHPATTTAPGRARSGR